MRPYKILSLTLCTIIGAGFATGKELLTYFTAYGTTGFITIFIASLLFTLAIHRVMTCPCNTLKDLLSPYPFSNLLLLTAQLFLLVLYSAMLSASGEVLHTIFNIPTFIGSLLVALLTTLIVIKGSEGISDLSQILFVPIVLIIFIISLTTTAKAITTPPTTLVTPKAILSPIIYVSYNMLTAIPLLISLPDKYLYKSCSTQVGTAIFILSTLLILPLYTHYSDIRTSALPLVALLSGTILYLYEFLLLLAIFSTAVSSAYSLLNTIKTTHTFIATILINIIAIIFSLIGFTQIVNKVYFIFGIAGILILIILFLPYKQKNRG